MREAKRRRFLYIYFYASHSGKSLKTTPKTGKDLDFRAGFVQLVDESNRIKNHPRKLFNIPSRIKVIVFTAKRSSFGFGIEAKPEL